VGKGSLVLQKNTPPPFHFLPTGLEEIRWGRLKMRDLLLKYNGILGLILSKTALIIAETSSSLQLTVIDVLTYVNFPTFAMADRRYGGQIQLVQSTACSKNVHFFDFPG